MLRVVFSMSWAREGERVSRSVTFAVLRTYRAEGRVGIVCGDCVGGTFTCVRLRWALSYMCTIR